MDIKLLKAVNRPNEQMSTRVYCMRKMLIYNSLCVLTLVSHINTEWGLHEIEAIGNPPAVLYHSLYT